MDEIRDTVPRYLYNDDTDNKTVNSEAPAKVEAVKFQNKPDTLNEQETLSTMSDNNSETNIDSVTYNSSGVQIRHKFIENHETEKVARDVPLTKYVWKTIIKESTNMERIVCAAMSISVIFSILVVLYYFLFVGKIIEDSDKWYIPRDDWFAEPTQHRIPIAYDQIKLVVVQHSVSKTCVDLVTCSAAVLALQHSSFEMGFADIPYNFVVANDGRIYEARGWGIESASSRWFNRCIICIGFIGNYNEIKPTELQLNRTKMFLDEYVKSGHLDKNYHLAAAKDLLPTESPGVYLHEALKEFEHYAHDKKFYRLCCEQIHFPEGEPFIDEAPHEWRITRDDWEADHYGHFNLTTAYNPLKLVIIDDIVNRHCYSFAVCRYQLTTMQGIAFQSDSEIQYNFAIGNDGRVYDIRGWGVEPGPDTLHFQPCAVYIGYFGNYTDHESYTQAEVSPAQVNRTMMLLKEGVEKGFLHRDYLVFAREVDGPGVHLHNEIRTWEHYDLYNQHETLTCDSSSPHSKY